ncbi:MAG: radical SAM protein [Proteobacteria bacterium]|nr:radical SAM protein [Pseudomonadota bacterium]
MRCSNCPRRCDGVSFCGKSGSIRVNIHQLHYWEEPPISGTRGSGTIFFSNCNLKCVFCQNYKISHLGNGQEITPSELVDMCWELKDQGAHNINFVTPTPYADKIIDVIKELKRNGFKLPFVWNCGGYESPDVIKAMNGVVDIYLPDFKYSDNKLAEEYSSAPGYYENAIKIIKEMKRQTVDTFDDAGIMQKGLIIRHLILPDQVENSKKVLRAIKETIGVNVLVSLMSQYCPVFKANEHNELGRKITPDEYHEVYDYFLSLGFEDGYTQDFGSATEYYIPAFH